MNKEAHTKEIVRAARVAVERLGLITRTRTFSVDAPAIAVYDARDNYFGTIDLDVATGMPIEGKPWLKRERPIQAQVMQALREAAEVSP